MRNQHGAIQRRTPHIDHAGAGPCQCAGRRIHHSDHGNRWRQNAPPLSFPCLAVAIMAVVLLTAWAGWPPSVQAQSEKISVEPLEQKVTVKFQGELFAEYEFGAYRKPVLYPLIAPGGVAITRHFPMRGDVPGEAQDHPHHKSVWFAHGDVNGVDFWSEKGSIKCTGIRATSQDSFQATHQWLGSDNQPICRDRTTIAFGGGTDWRSVDYHVTVLATPGDITFGDTKEGMFGVRTHPNLRLQGQDGQSLGSAANSEGIVGKAIWGQPAKWVHYHGDIDGTTFGLTMMDHPANLRHPTTWHARDYGLIAANPFGLHHFQGQPPGRGDHTIKAGDQLEFRYRILITRGPRTVRQINSEFETFAKSE